MSRIARDRRTTARRASRSAFSFRLIGIGQRTDLRITHLGGAEIEPVGALDGAIAVAMHPAPARGTVPIGKNARLHQPLHRPDHSALAPADIFGKLLVGNGHDWPVALLPVPRLGKAE